MIRKRVRWSVNTSAVSAYFKVPKGWEKSGYFYTGPTLDFGHEPSQKKRKKH